MASKKPIIALMYDFDKTLCTTDMQAYLHSQPGHVGQ